MVKKLCSFCTKFTISISIFGSTLIIHIQLMVQVSKEIQIPLRDISTTSRAKGFLDKGMFIVGAMVVVVELVSVGVSSKTPRLSINTQEC